jgi:hypothetical protein
MKFDLKLDQGAMFEKLRFALMAGGWPAVVGMVLIAVGIGGFLLVVPQQWDAATGAKNEAERSQRECERLNAGAEKGPGGVGQALVEFRELLTAEEQADEAMEIIQRDAKKHGLALSGTEYKWQRQPKVKLAEVRIAIPVKASYSPLRAFVKDVLTDVPGLALDQFELQRENIGSSDVDARLRFSLFLKVGT